ncbi:MAG: rhamnulokinase [Spirochaetales bacterium]|jgi:rhamnulokinase|nr:rhamnulokinase [Spirochaetales bacterium]
MAYRNVLAIDLGASSGRGFLGRFDGRQVALEQINRFENFPVAVGEHLKWPIYYLAQSVITTLSKAVIDGDGEIASIGIDTWGVDFGLVGVDEDLCLTPHHYRDRRTEKMLSVLDSVYGSKRLFERTGISYQPFNTSLQLLSLSQNRPQLFDRADTFLMIPDILTFLLTGERSVEFTNASTTQLASADTKNWAVDILDALEVPVSIMPSIHHPGDQTGTILTAVNEATDLQGIPTIAVASHDTASAVATQILPDESTIFISSGTWSLVGAITDTPITGDEASKDRFNNEWTHNGKFMFLKNIMGLWLLQECRKEWNLQGANLSYQDISTLASNSSPFRSLINPDDVRFYAPRSMIDAIQNFCKESRQPIPESPEQIARAIYESLALDYRATVTAIGGYTNRLFTDIYVVGGGAQDALLNTFTASATDRPVVAGSSEASALGNALVQLYGIGEIGSFDDFESVVRESTDLRTFEPIEHESWEIPFQRFLDLRNNPEMEVQ